MRMPDAANLVSKNSRGDSGLPKIPFSIQQHAAKPAALWPVSDNYSRLTIASGAG